VKVPKIVPVAAILVVLALWFVVTHVSAQLAKPNLSGTWELNPTKSKLLRVHRGGTDRYKITHSEPQLWMEHTYSSRSETSRSTTDGTPMPTDPDHRDVLAKAYWDGGTLVIERHYEIDEGRFRFTWVGRYKLSQDGQSLAVTQHVTRNSFSLDLDESLVYDKRK
jgi:hypothetical protein